MSDYISRQAAIDALHTRFKDGFNEDKWWNSTHVLAAIEGLPPANCSEFPNNSDTISRKAAIDRAVSIPMFGRDVKMVAVSEIKNLPSAQPQRMRGEWIDVTKTGGAELWKRSECGELELEDSYFCPNCGADMREVDE